MISITNDPLDSKSTPSLMIHLTNHQHNQWSTSLLINIITNNHLRSKSLGIYIFSGDNISVQSWYTSIPAEKKKRNLSSSTRTIVYNESWSPDIKKERCQNFHLVLKRNSVKILVYRKRLTRVEPLRVRVHKTTLWLWFPCQETACWETL
jgi:hypothetical protein